MAEMKWERYKFHRCLSKKAKHLYQLRPIGGDCLEGVGIPDKGRALINCQIEPKVGDIVWCDNCFGTIHGYLKQVKSINGDEMIVQTKYKDKSRDFEFYASAIYGVVEMVFDFMGDLRYIRSEPGKELDLLKSTITRKEEAEAEIERLKHILDCYALQYGTVKEQQDVIDKANQEFASEIFAEIEKEIDRGLSVIEKILNTKSGRANGKTVLISKYDVYREAKKHLAELKKKYTEGEQ